MIDNFSYEDVSEDVMGFIKKSDLNVDFQKNGKNKFLLSLYNDGKEELEDVIVTVYDRDTNKIIAAYDFEALKGEERISKTLSFSNEKQGEKILDIIAEYTARGEARRLSNSHQISLTKESDINVSIFTIIVITIAVLLFICLYILFKNTNNQLIRFAFKNLARNRTRTILTFIGIVIGIRKLKM